MLCSIKYSFHTVEAGHRKEEASAVALQLFLLFESKVEADESITLIVTVQQCEFYPLSFLSDDSRKHCSATSFSIRHLTKISGVNVI